MNHNQAISADDEVAKKNTDCVYFLASPLTCKKVFAFFFISMFLDFSNSFYDVDLIRI